MKLGQVVETRQFQIDAIASPVLWPIGAGRLVGVVTADLDTM